MLVGSGRLGSNFEGRTASYNEKFRCLCALIRRVRALRCGPWRHQRAEGREVCWEMIFHTASVSLKSLFAVVKKSVYEFIVGAGLSKF